MPNSTGRLPGRQWIQVRIRVFWETLQRSLCWNMECERSRYVSRQVNIRTRKRIRYSNPSRHQYVWHAAYTRLFLPIDRRRHELRRRGTVIAGQMTAMTTASKAHSEQSPHCSSNPSRSSTSTSPSREQSSRSSAPREDDPKPSRSDNRSSLSTSPS